eukprot:TRINITY_DN6511_c0_g1_i1.p1 TRINITY_DN6511_c0_g1~~TRINITY_DN6511_c0_g1_i1.p1  ORF type:complete len:260 (-),score=41.78 TRINITY_DN6511_c0_g1_i1:97-876(-)
MSKLDQIRDSLCSDLKYQVENCDYYPWFAIDECHYPLYDMKGVIFHGDYNKYEVDFVLNTYRYETGEEKVRPEGYKYTERTSMFGLFRAVLDNYLCSEYLQMTIFSTTVFEVWRNYQLNEKTLYSRERPKMEQFTALYRFSQEDNDIPPLLLGRPGWYYEYYLKDKTDEKIKYLSVCLDRLQEVLEQNRENKCFLSMINKIAYNVNNRRDDDDSLIRMNISSLGDLCLNFGVLLNWEGEYACISIDEPIVKIFLKRSRQ